MIEGPAHLTVEKVGKVIKANSCRDKKEAGPFLVTAL